MEPLEKYHLIMKEAREYLGNECINCGTKENLEFDHIDPKTKSFTIGKDWSIFYYQPEVWWDEINKCQLLCEKCHTNKTLKDLGRESAKDKHGSLSSYKYCKCDLCRKAKNDWQIQYQIEHGIKSGKKRKDGTLYSDKIEEILELSRQGLSAYKIAPIVGISRATVDRIVRRNK